MTRACSQVFVDLIVDPILPTYLELLDGGKPMPVIVLEDWPRPGPNEGGGANGGVSVDGSWDRAYNEVSNLLKDLVRSLKGALPPNDASEWVSGYRSGPRLDTRLLMPARIDPSRMLRAFERQTWNDSRQYRVGIGVDLSGSMEGAPLRQVGRGAVLVLEACEKLKVRTSVVGFGSTPHDEAVVLKHPWERLRDARPRLRAAMFDQLRLGDETPLLAALDLLGGLHVPEPGVFDLLLVLTDGHPSRRFSPRRAPQKRDGPWEAGYTEQCEATVQRLQSDNCLVLGVDVGERACIGKVFERHITVADVSGLPEALRGVLGAFLQG